MKPVCAITGASGYVGSRIAAALAQDFEILPLGRNPGPSGIGWHMAGEQSIAQSLRLRGTKVLVHSAWDFNCPRPEDNWKSNVEGSRRLLDDARAAGIQRIVFVSTISAFAGARSEYGKAKLAVERMVLDAGGAVIRPGLVWGSRPGGMFGSLREQVRKGSIVPTIGDGRYPQFLVHEDDLADTIRRAAVSDAGFSGRTLTLAHPNGILLCDLILRLAADEGRSVRLVGIPWRVIYAGLRTAEALGLKLGFRSDSVLSLVYQDPRPHFASGIPVRPFL
jgi:nucleoside-diphosphate-sugar epimerase